MQSKCSWALCIWKYSGETTGAKAGISRGFSVVPHAGRTWARQQELKQTWAGWALGYSMQRVSYWDNRIQSGCGLSDPGKLYKGDSLVNYV